MDKLVGREKLIRLLLLYWWKKKKCFTKRSVTRKLWVRSIFTETARVRSGAHDNLIREMRLCDSKKYFNFCRMSAENFDKLLNLVGPEITKIYFHCKPLSASLRLHLCLRYLASGDSMVSISYLFRVGVSTVSAIIKETCDAIWKILQGMVLCQNSSEDFWKRIALNFLQEWQFPHSIGAIDRKQVVVQAPPKSGSTYFNYKKTHSIVILAICDAYYNFTYFEAGFEGRNSDGGIFRNSVIGQKLENKTLNIPQISQASSQGRQLPYVLVGDEAFPLSQYMMRPYPGNELTIEQQVYNYRLSRCRRTIENTFGIWVSRWRIFRKPIVAHPSTVNSIIRATVCLHNYIKSEEAKSGSICYAPPALIDNELPDGTVRPGDWRNNDSSGLINICTTGTRNYTRVAAAYTKEFTDYFMEEGIVEWQWESINK